MKYKPDDLIFIIGNFIYDPYKISGTVQKIKKIEFINFNNKEIYRLYDLPIVCEDDFILLG